MASAELIVAFGAKIDGLEASLKRVTTKFEELERSAAKSSTAVERSMESTNTSLLGMVRNVRQVAAAFAVFQAIRIGTDIALQIDDVNQSLVRLRFLLGNNPQAGRQVFENLADVARRTGAPISALTDQFVRFRVALNSIGATNQQVTQLVETLSNFARVSGSRPQEAVNAIIQLGQGLASGKLGGEELRSVLENTPLLAQELARELGVTVGELRKMGEEGKLVAENVFPALLRAGERIRDQIKDLPLGVRQSFEVARTAWTQLIEHIDTKVGASTGISRMLQAAAAGLDLIRRSTGGQTAREEAESLERQIQRQEARVQELQNQLRTGQSRPDVGIGGAVSAPDPMTRRERESIQRELATAEIGLVELRRLRERNARETAETERIEGDRIAEERLRQQQSQGRAENREQIEQLDRRARLRREAADAEKAAERIAASGQLRDAEGREQTLADRIKQIRDKLREDIAAIDRSETAQSREEAARRQRLREQEARQTQEALAMFRRLDDNPLRNFQDAMENLNRAAPGSTVGSPMDVMFRSIQAGGESVATLFGAITSEAEKAAIAMVRAGQDPQPVIDALNEQIRVLRERLLGIGQSEENIDKALSGPIAAMERNLDRVREKAESTWLDIASRATKTFSSDLAGSVVDFATTAENKFDEMAANFLKNVAKMILEFMILRALVTGLRAFNINLPGLGGAGGVGGANGLGRTWENIQGRMAGGPVSAGTPYIVGERRPELFVPGSSGYVFPDVGRNNDTTINVYNNSGANVRANETSDSFGNRILEIFVEDVVRKGMAAGRFDSPLRQNFNITRPGRV